MHKRLLFIPLLFAASAAWAQTNFQPGYVISLSGDTLRGEVDSRGAQRNARLARFRPSADGSITEYQPRQLRGYGFDDDRVYQTETVVLPDSVSRQSPPAATADTLRRPAFLEVIVQGPASLLYLRDKLDKDHYYLRMTGQPVQELLQISSQVEVNGKTYLRKSDDFRRTLAAATQQCLMLQPSINTVRYNGRDLTRLISRYNECVGGTSVAPASETRKNHVQLGVVLGAERSQLEVSNTFTNTTAKGYSSVQPVIGLGMLLRLTGLSRTISGRIEALYEKQSYQIEVPEAQIQYRATLASVRVPLLLRYTYPRGKIRPMIYAGYGFSYFLQNANEVRSMYSSGGSSNWRPFVTEPRRLEQGIQGGVGLITNRASGRNLAVDLRYERSDGFSDAIALGSRLNRFYLLLSYDLTK